MKAIRKLLKNWLSNSIAGCQICQIYKVSFDKGGVYNDIIHKRCQPSRRCTAIGWGT